MINVTSGFSTQCEYISLDNFRILWNKVEIYISNIYTCKSLCQSCRYCLNTCQKYFTFLKIQFKILLIRKLEILIDFK